MKNKSFLRGLNFNKTKVFLASHKKLSAAFLFVLVLATVGFFVFAKKKDSQQFQTTAVEKGTIVSSVSASQIQLNPSVLMNK